MSHLVSSEERENPLNGVQLDRFKRIRAAFPLVKASFANSSGVFLGADYHFDLARPGCAIYGVNPTPGLENPVRTVVRLEARILQVREIDHPDPLAMVPLGRRLARRKSQRSPVVTPMDGCVRFPIGGPPTSARRRPRSSVEYPWTSSRSTSPTYRMCGRARWSSCWARTRPSTRSRSARARTATRCSRAWASASRAAISTGGMNNPLAIVGRFFLGFLQQLGEISLFSARAVSHCFRPPFYFRHIFRQMLDIGYFSLPVVGLTALFTGMVLALQSYTGFARFSAESAVATVVVLSVTRELGPVIAGLMVAGRIGASIAAEIGTMRVTEQIDALYTLSTNPMKYLVAPRLIAGAVTLPMLVVIADIIGVFGGYIVGVFPAQLHISVEYIRANRSSSNSWTYLRPRVLGKILASLPPGVTELGCHPSVHMM